MSTQPSTGSEVQPRYWIGELLATLCGIYAAVLAVMAVALSEQTLEKMELSASLCIGGAALLAVLCVLLAWQAAADRGAAEGVGAVTPPAD